MIMHRLQFHLIKFVPIKTIYEFVSLSRDILYQIQTNQNESMSEHVNGFNLTSVIYWVTEKSFSE